VSSCCSARSRPSRATRFPYTTLFRSVGAYHLMRPHHGRGQLLGGVPGAPRGNVLVLGGGVAGEQAARVAVGMQANVTILDVSLRSEGPRPDLRYRFDFVSRLALETRK